jgi:hypothetical protein
MWPHNFASRLDSWARLRDQASALPISQALSTVNAWWFQAPWRAYHLHWDDQTDWPDPWQLLDDNVYCPLARGLGIMYTIVLLDRNDLQDAHMIENGGDNLVLVNNEKYILNWDPTEIVNISPSIKQTSKFVTQEQIKQHLR